VIKYGIIYDASFSNNSNGNYPGFWPVIRENFGRSSLAVAKSRPALSEDETETRVAKHPEFGHTIGHALEAISHYGEFLHGEAIAVGTGSLPARLSHEILGLPQTDVERIRQLFERAGLPTCIKLTSKQRRNLIAAMRLDKKVSASQIKFVLAKRIGKVNSENRFQFPCSRKCSHH